MSELAEPKLAVEFRDAMCRLAGAVNIVTTCGDEPRGLTMTAVCSVTADPPTVLACVSKDADAHDHIQRNGNFCINVLGHEDSDLADRFAARDGSKGAVRFEDRNWRKIDTGAPALDTALVALDCELAKSVDAGTHTLFFGRVKSVRQSASDPLIYFDRSYRTLG